MTMTHNEAEARAKRIWGDRVFRLLKFSPNAIHWQVELRDDGRGHVLDGNGHTACHAECEALEQRGTDEVAREAQQQRAQATTFALVETITADGEGEDDLIFPEKKTVKKAVRAGLSEEDKSWLTDVAAIRQSLAVMRSDIEAIRFAIGEIQRLLAPVSPPDRDDDDIRF